MSKLVSGCEKCQQWTHKPETSEGWRICAIFRVMCPPDNYCEYFEPPTPVEEKEVEDVPTGE